MQLSETCFGLDDRIRSKVVEWILVVVRQVRELKRRVSEFVQAELFKGQVLPPRSDARYWPSNLVLMGLAYRTRMKYRSVCTMQPDYD